jgi:hypothetical protein
MGSTLQGRLLTFPTSIRQGVIEQVAWNKSSLLLKIQMQNTQTFQLFTINIKTEIIYISYQNAMLGSLGTET